MRLPRSPYFWTGITLFTVALFIALTLDWRGVAIYCATGLGAVAFVGWTETGRR